MIVAGGIYHERCEFPYSEELYGPGLRSVSAIQEISEGTNELHTCVGSSDRSELELKSSAYNFTVRDTEIPETITFQYLHNHSNASVISSIPSRSIDLGRITGDAILRFGLVEGTATVDGGRVVYDPQSAEPEPFHKNGSEADKLAIVMNQHEARNFTGKDSLRDMLETLTTGEDSGDIAIIKCGASGAILQAGDQVEEIPVYETEQVWNIGSGDIFSGIFSVYWAELEYSPFEAAQKASLATAYYCNNGPLPIPEKPNEIDKFNPEEKDPTVGEKGPTVYLASPFFNLGDFWLVEEVRRILYSEGADVISPYHDIGRLENFEESEQVAEEDLAAIERADVVLGLVDNCDPGTYFELGYARKIGKPVVAYTNQVDQHRDIMLEGGGCKLCNDLSTAVFKAMWT